MIACRCRSPFMPSSSHGLSTTAFVEIPDFGAPACSYRAPEKTTRRDTMSAYTIGRKNPESGLGLKLFALFAGVTIPIVMLIGLWLAISADKARSDANRAAARAQT